MVLMTREEHVIQVLTWIIFFLAVVVVVVAQILGGGYG